jgi:hypothetical protein
MKQLLLLLALIFPSFAQTPRLDYVRDMTARGSLADEYLPGVDYAGMFFSTVQVSPGQAIRKVPTLPATCTAVGSASSSNAVLYQGRVYQCTATNTWAFAVGQTAALTAGRLPFVGTGGVLTDSANALLTSGGVATFVGGLRVGTASSGFSGEVVEISDSTNGARFIGSDGLNSERSVILFQSPIPALGNNYARLLAYKYGTGAGFLPLLLNDSGGTVIIGTVSSLNARLGVISDVSTRVGAIIRGAASQSANILETQNSSGTALTYVDASGRLYPLSVAFASLGTPSNGAVVYCSDCTKATPCAGSGNGALAKRLNGAWDCD